MKEPFLEYILFYMRIKRNYVSLEKCFIMRWKPQLNTYEEIVKLQLNNYCLCHLIGSRDIKIPFISQDLFFRQDL